MPFADAARTWLKIGLLGFGGPAGQIALMHRILVDEKRWVSDEQFLHALNYCMLLPGPEAQQLSVYIGWLLHRVRGGLVAGVLFVAPGAIVIWILSVLYARYQGLELVESIFDGVKVAVLAIVIQALLRIGKRALKDRLMAAIALVSFAAIFVFKVSFPLIVFAAGVGGYLQSLFTRSHASTNYRNWSSGLHTGPALVRSFKVLSICLSLWLLPVFGLIYWLGPESVYSQEAVFFSKMAVVTFGGAYAVLAYVAQQAVDVYGWLAPGEMLDGLGLAETTPGPLIMVVQFVGFLGAYRNPGLLDPVLAGTLGAVLTTWVTFVPCFLWIFLGAPYIEALRGNHRLNGAMSAITAAVVGVILNLTLWFALHVLFDSHQVFNAFGMSLQLPLPASVDWFGLALAIAALVAVLHFRIGMFPVLALAASAGMAQGFLMP